VTTPSIAEAQAVLAEARARNPGPWADHCQVAAAAARAVAAHHPALEPERAYVLALLHDVGRGRGGPGVADVRHIMDGYAAMQQCGFPECARICLTHSFPIKDTDAFAGAWDCPADEKRFVQDYLDNVEYTHYDRLVQLCDAIALPSGPCLMEKRLVDVALRHGFNRLTQAKWRAYLALLEQFSQAIGASIYTVLPGVVETTFSSPS
jgi:hypothetical protein